MVPMARRRMMSVMREDGWTAAAAAADVWRINE